MALLQFVVPAFVLLFMPSLALHVVFGTNAYNEERALIGQPPISIAAFLLSAKFWSSTPHLAGGI